MIKISKSHQIRLGKLLLCICSLCTMYDHYDVYLLLLIWFVVNINDKNLYFIYRYLLLRHFLKEMSENSFSETLIITVEQYCLPIWLHWIDWVSLLKGLLKIRLLGWQTCQSILIDTLMERRCNYPPIHYNFPRKSRGGKDRTMHCCCNVLGRRIWARKLLLHVCCATIIIRALCF